MAQKKEVKEDSNRFSDTDETYSFNGALTKIEEGKKLISEANKELLALMSQKPALSPDVETAYMNFDDRKKSFEHDAEKVEMINQMKSALREIDEKERQLLDLATENEGLKEEIVRLNGVSNEVIEERRIMVEQLNDLKNHALELRKRNEDIEEANKKRMFTLRQENEEKIGRLIRDQTEREIELKVRVEQLTNTLSKQKVFVESKERMMRQLMNEIVSAFHRLFPDTPITQISTNLETQVASVRTPGPGEKGFDPSKEGLMNLDFNFKNPLLYRLSDNEEQIEIAPMVDIALAQGDSFESIKYSLMSSGYRKHNVEKVLKEKI